MATWSDVERVGLTLPETSLGVAHEGSRAILVGSRQFARLRWDDADNEVLQFWVPDADLVDAYEQTDPGTYRSAAGFSKKVVMARLSPLDHHTVRELLVESWHSRASASLRKAYTDLR